ncbi:MAG: N-acetylmuramoyl-L-alanine amidase [Cytophagaceae bacterium]|nr:N-acetylmuramoyl-L-alanine amidase [Cytophagaceae bacterium]
MRNFALITLFSAIFVLSSFSELEISQYKIRTVIIDAGHGGKDPGCHGKNTNEATITLQVALELGKIIKENLPEVKIVYTRSTDKFVELHERANIANKNNADLFISIHCNSGPPTVDGTETYTMGLHTSKGNLEVAKRENAVVSLEDDHEKNYKDLNPDSPAGHILISNWQKAYLENSVKFASKVEIQFKTRVGRNSRGVKQAGLLVLWKSTMPSVLIEIGFLTNSKEEKYLNNQTNRTYVASAIYRAFKEYKKELESMNE